jgi:hypothetical protein
MDEDDFGYEDYEASPYNGDDLDGGAHDGHYEAEDYYEDTVELEESYDPPGWEDDLYHAWEVE